MLSNLSLPDVYYYVARILGMAIAIPFHEVSHAFVSDKLGDHTARDAGRLTLNPIKHFDLFGFLSMLIIGVGWAKPVPVDARYYKNRKAGMALTAVAGPVANLLLALVGTVLFKVASYLLALYAFSAGLAAYTWWMEGIYYVLFYFTLINISLALFNLLPIPPLDGSRVFGLVLPEKLYFGIMRYERYIMIALLAAMFILPRLGINPLGWLLNDAANAVFSAMDWLTGWIDAIFQAIFGFQ